MIMRRTHYFITLSIINTKGLMIVDGQQGDKFTCILILFIHLYDGTQLMSILTKTVHNLQYFSSVSMKNEGNDDNGQMVEKK